MVGKTYLRYVVGPQGGALASNAAQSMDAAVIPPSYAGARRRPGGAVGRKPPPPSPSPSPSPSRPNATAATTPTAALFLPSLEAVRVVAVRSGRVLHALVPAEEGAGGGGGGGGPLEVTALQAVALGPGGWLLAVGYAHGAVAAFSAGPATPHGAPRGVLHATGHRVGTAVWGLAVDAAGLRLCSGGQDTAVVVWDLAGQDADYALQGHRGGVVGLVLPPRAPDRLVSAAADGLVKVWDLARRVCVQTVVASDAQVTAVVADAAGQRLYCGLRENVLKVYRLQGDGDAAGPASNNGALTPGKIEDGNFVVDHGTIARRYHKPITSLKFSPDSNYLLACTSKTVEVYRMLSAESVRRKVTRKRKRQREALEKRRERQADEPHKDVAGGDELEGRGTKPSKRRPHPQVKESDAPEGDLSEEENEEHQCDTTAAEEVTLLRTFFLTEDKVRAACFVPAPQAAHDPDDDNASDTLHIAVLFNNNSIKTYTTRLTLNDAEGAATWSLEDLKLRHTLGQQVHQSDIRALSFVDNDSALLSLSKEKLLLWRLSVNSDHLEREYLDDQDFYDAKEANLARITFKGSLNCYNSSVDWAETGDATAEAVAMAAISSNLCCVGLNNGTVCLVDAAASEITFVEPVFHVGGVKGVSGRPDESGFLTLGSDRRVVLWTLGLMAVGPEKDGGNRASKPSGAAGPRRVTLLPSTEIELSELPLFAQFSPDKRFLGVGLNNHNIQLFFADTLKPYLLLFGHKLPPTSLSFSTDGTLVASVGMDKSLRFWGTDFGDCHRAIHAHDDYITQVEFVKDTHYVFTVSMDGAVKQWDGDHWTMIQLFRQHPRGLWAVAVTRNGTCVATAGVDKCIRCFLRTSELLFPAEEEERRAQAAMDEEAAQRAALQRLAQSSAAGDGGPEAVLAGQPTAATAEAAERLMEALDLVSVELQRAQNPADTTAARHPLLGQQTVWAYLWSVIESIRPSELRHALASLTSVHVHALLDYLEGMVEHRAVQSYEVAAKMLLALVMPAPGQAPGSIGLRTAAIYGEVSQDHGARRLEKLRRVISYGLNETVNRIDYNIAGLQMVRRYMEATDKVKFFDRSKIQGYKKKYHTRALPQTNEKE